MFNIETGKLGPAESSGETNQDKRPVSKARQALIAHRTNPPDVRGRERRRTPGPGAMPAADAAQGLANSWMLGVERPSRHTEGAGDGCHAAAQRGRRVAFTGRRQISSSDRAVIS